MKIFLKLLDIIGYFSIILIIPIIGCWVLDFYLPVLIFSCLMLIFVTYIIIKKLNIKYKGLKILAIILLTTILSYAANSIFGCIMQWRSAKLVNDIDSIEISYDLHSYTVLSKDKYQNSIKFVKGKFKLAKGSFRARVNFKNGKSIMTDIYYFNPDHPEITINNYNYQLY